MAKLGIVTTPPIGTPLPDGGGNINSNFDELYSLLGDGNNLYPGIVTSITAGDNISISTSFGNVSISVTSTAFTETLDSVTDRGNLTTNGIRVGVLTANAFIKTGGTSSQFLKADGTVDSNTYLTSGSPVIGDLDDVTNNGNTTNNVISVGAVSALGNLSAGVNVTAASNVSAGGSIFATSNVSAGGSITAGGVSVASSFVKVGGSSSEFLKADGSIDTNEYATVTFVNENAGYWIGDPVGINTSSNVGIGTSAGGESLIVNGDVKIVGVLTVGSSSITIDGDRETISIGNTISIGSTEIYVGSGVTIREDGISINGQEVADRWIIDSVGISTTVNVGIGTTADSDYTLKVAGIVSATAFLGDGSGLTNISGVGDTTGLASVEYVDQQVGLSTVGLASTDYVDSLVGFSTEGLLSETGDGSQLTGIITTIFDNDSVIKSYPLFVEGTAGDQILKISSDYRFTPSTDTLEVNNLTATGIVTASTLYGDGSNLTGVVSQNYVDDKVGIATDGLASIEYVDSSFATLIGAGSSISWTLGNDGVNNYTFSGPGFTGSVNNPSLTLVRGQRYNFTNNMGAYPFRIQLNPGTSGTPYNSGIENNGVTNGTLQWEVQFNSPSTLYYQSVTNPNMQGEIKILDNVGTASTNGLASVEYVDQKVGLSTVGLATTEFVDAEVFNQLLEGGYATIGYVDQQIAQEIAGLSTAGISTEGLATERYVDSAIVGLEVAPVWQLTANATNTNYIFNGPGFSTPGENPTITLVRGNEYKFVNSMGAHPFRIQSSPGIGGTAYNDGIVGNDISNGVLTWDVQFDAPQTLYYQCTSHALMGGVIHILSENSDYATKAEVGLSTAGLASIDYVDSVAGVGTVYWGRSSGILTPITDTDSIFTLGNITGTVGQFADNLNLVNPNSYLNAAGGGNFAGVVTATSFSGDGSNIIEGRWILGSISSDNYTFTGIGFTQTTADPDLYLARGRVYEFVNDMNAHGFQIQDTPNGTIGNPYNNGVTNNGTTNGIVRIEVPFNAPDTLYYQCTSHVGMGGTIFIYPALR